MAVRTVELEISDIGFGGKGVGRADGKAIFVPFTIPGERIVAEIRREKKNFAEAKLVSVEQSSPDRIEPECVYFGTCGGCAFQHISYERQLAVKSSQVEQLLRRIGRFASVPMQPIVPSPLQYGYRNRIRVHVEDGRVGFYSHGSHALIEIKRCPIAAAEVNDALTSIRSRAVQDGDYTLSARRTAVFFEQTNDGVAAALLALARASVRSGQTLLVDAYCGAGFFAHGMADLFTKVIGIEENQHAVGLAIRQAAENESYLPGDVALQLGEVLAQHDATRTTVLVDPPAAGLAPRALELLIASEPSEILYVSCDPATLARDLAALCQSVYRLVSVTPLDMFPQTAEIEVLVRLERITRPVAIIEDLPV